MNTKQKIAVTGATGRVGRHIVDILEARGHDVVPIARSRGVDVITGDGLAEALEGVTTIIDAATGPSPDEQEATAFFTTSARNIQEAAARAGVQRIVLVSIVGIDRFSAGYNAAKLAQERLMLEGPVPAQILRATQFHEFVEELMNWGRQDGVIYVWQMRTQLVAARSVAEALADMATSEDPLPAGAPIPEIAGPREESLVEAAKLLAARRGDPARVDGVLAADDPSAELYANGAALPGPGATLAGPTFEEWLETAA
jgi:uncharacterized protein YbjT (DUF2867 family)